MPLKIKYSIWLVGRLIIELFLAMVDLELLSSIGNPIDILLVIKKLLFLDIFLSSSILIIIKKHPLYISFELLFV